MNVLPSVLMALCLLAGFLTRRKLYRYLEEHYPKEWARASYNPMRMRPSSVRIANLQESMKHGTLSTINDKVIEKHKRTERIWIATAAAAVIIQLVYTYFK